MAAQIAHINIPCKVLYYHLNHSKTIHHLRKGEGAKELDASEEAVTVASIITVLCSCRIDNLYDSQPVLMIIVIKSLTTTATNGANMIKPCRNLKTVHKQTISRAKQGKGLHQKHLHKPSSK